MDEDRITLEEGVISKSATIEPQEVTSSDMAKINKYALTPLKSEDVFVFKSVIGDNETDDRNFEPFNAAAIKDMARLYKGRPVIKDHFRKADNQVARIYDTELVTEDKVTGAGEPFVKMVAKSYMIRTSSNADLIKEIQAGIKKEVSTGVRPKRLICNICGVDNAKSYCPHWPGREYDKDTGKTTCMITIDGVKEAYELSLVAVPAQPRAGTIKNYGPKPPAEPEKDTTPEKTLEKNETEVKDLEVRITNERIEESLNFVKMSKETDGKDVTNE